MFDVGLIITLVGMLGVFVFLILLVFSMSIMSTIIQKVLPEKEVVVPVKAKPTQELEIAIAIAAIKSLSSKESH
ncbi:oxaloacetate decarboxylase [Thiospirochaeta perfilievii]|uniref:Oxaloacetate decarboxylase n=1 Tax=Thiospirochaeta perfilievii TaxID=252967 RepID=A0A5C1QAH4_9SPIO|nr:OadG family protein [Thiospirochaeta perfilievii]QEN04477.1 oxaloacetate decarboxylase [Thiospirochaeta perfilievii]